MSPAPHRPTRVRRGPLLAALALASWCASRAGEGQAAVTLTAARQRSSGPVSSLVGTNLTVPAGANRLLIVAVALAGTSASVRSARFRGQAMILSAMALAPMGSCRSELWWLVDPPVGTGQLDVDLSASVPMGVGMLVFSGVDPQQPLGAGVANAGTSGSPTLSVRVPDDRPLVAAACLGGDWTSTTGAPATMAVGEASLWDFTEGDVVGVGMTRTASAGLATARWSTSGGQPYTWSVMGMTITPTGAGLPAADAGADLAPPPRETGADLAATPDTSGELPPAPGDLPPAPDLPAPVDLSPAADRSAPDDAAFSEDAGLPIPADGGAQPDRRSVDDGSLDEPRRVELDVGCACRTGRDHPGTALPIAVGFAGLALAARRWRTVPRR